MSASSMSTSLVLKSPVWCWIISITGKFKKPYTYANGFSFYRGVRGCFCPTNFDCSNILRNSRAHEMNPEGWSSVVSNSDWDRRRWVLKLKRWGYWICACTDFKMSNLPWGFWIKISLDFAHSDLSEMHVRDQIRRTRNCTRCDVSNSVSW